MRRRGVARFGINGDLPAGCRHVKYLRSNKKQYIDLGIYPSSSFRLCTKFFMPVYPDDTFATLFGEYNNGTASGYALYLNNTIPIQARTGVAGTGNIITNYNVEANVNFSIELYFNRLIINGDSFTPTRSHVWLTPDRSLLLFGCNSNEAEQFLRRKMAACVYYFKYYEGSSLILDLVPIVKQSGSVGTPYMFDLVSRTYLPFGNAGTGTFGWEELDGTVVSPT